jgi:hypothetical protein
MRKHAVALVTFFGCQTVLAIMVFEGVENLKTITLTLLAVGAVLFMMSSHLENPEVSLSPGQKFAWELLVRGAHMNFFCVLGVITAYIYTALSDDTYQFSRIRKVLFISISLMMSWVTMIIYLGRRYLT